MNKIIFTRHFGCQNYSKVIKIMQNHIASRQYDDHDQLLIGEHPSCYTQGIRSHHEQPHMPTPFPVYASNRGGLITYHGPGQIILYPLLNIKRLGLSHKDYVHELESMLIDFLNRYEIISQRRANAPGIYTQSGEKIASLGLRIRNHISYHGVALNVRMDLSPFSAITPCGLTDIRMIDMQHFNPNINIEAVQREIISIFGQHFGYNTMTHKEFDYHD